MKRINDIGMLIDVQPFTSERVDIRVYDKYEPGKILETVSRTLYVDKANNQDLYVNYGACFRYVKQSTRGYFMYVDVNTLPVGKTVERAY